MNWEQHFRKISRSRKYSREYSVAFGSDFNGNDLKVGFGAMARGTAIAGTNGAVIPPGRYWLDIVLTKDKWSIFTSWLKSKPEVTVEYKENNISMPWPGMWELINPLTNPSTKFIIFNIPANASNYGKPGVWFPTVSLGFPTIAPATGPQAVTKMSDTSTRPPPVTIKEAIRDAPKTLGNAVGNTLGTVAEGVGEVTGQVGKGLFEGLGAANLIKLIAIGGLAAFVAYNLSPVSMLKKVI